MNRAYLTVASCLLLPSSLVAFQQAADPESLASNHESVSGTDSFIGGGRRHRASGDRSVVTGGYGNVASGYGATVSGGQLNAAGGANATVGGGTGNVTSAEGSYGAGHATVGGGLGNVAGGDYATIAGGRENLASGFAPSIGGGWLNVADGFASTVGGGAGNEIPYAYGGVVAGGTSNLVTSTWGTVCGGTQNEATGFGFSTVGGGVYNWVTGSTAVIAGGGYNTASGSTSTIPGGAWNVAAGNNSFAAGTRAIASHDGSFVWGDAFDDSPNPSTKISSAENEFNVYASGGTRVFSSSDGSTGVLLAPGAGSWTTVSDRNAKENVEPVDGRAVLEQLASIPISTWNYEAQDDSVRHMGPMAQDFHAAFGLGLGDTSIDTIDPDGVALAAIQGLHELVETQRAEIEQLRERVATLEAGAAGDRAR